MRTTFLLALLFTCTAALPARAFEIVLTRKIHTDPVGAPGKEIPAKDSTQVMWFSKDRMRVETDDMTMIVRLDKKKMYLLDEKQKVASVIDLPFDLKSYMPPEVIPMFEKNAPKCTVTPTTEEKKIGDWNTRKFSVNVTSPMGMSLTEEVWVTKDLKLDYESYKEMSRQVLSMSPGNNSIADEMMKVDGVSVMTSRTRNMRGTETKTLEELVSVENKPAPEGAFEVPADFQQKPFDPMSDMQRRAPMMKVR